MAFKQNVVIDEMTCMGCKERDGKVTDEFEDPIEFCSNAEGCRCTVIKEE